MKKNLCYWLEPERVQEIEDNLAKIASVPHPISSTYLNTSEVLNNDADTFMPVNKDTGWRSSDIDLLQSPSTDPRIINTLAGRMIRNSEPLNEGISDDILEDSVIPRDLNAFDTVPIAGSLAKQISELKDAEPKPQPVPEPIKTE